MTAHPGAPGALAQVIRELIFRKTKLTASAGIGPNKLIAKIASDMKKPNGQYEVTPEEVPEFMADFAGAKILGNRRRHGAEARAARGQDMRRLAAILAARNCRSMFGKFGRGVVRTMPRDRSAPGRAGSRAQIAQQRGNVPQAISNTLGECERTVAGIV